MWVAPDDLYVLAAQNAIGNRNSVKLGGRTDTLLGYSFFKISLILCGTTAIHCAKHVPLKNGHAPTLLFEPLQARIMQMLPPKPLNLLFSTIM